MEIAFVTLLERGRLVFIDDGLLAAISTGRRASRACRRPCSAAERPGPFYASAGYSSEPAFDCGAGPASWFSSPRLCVSTLLSLALGSAPAPVAGPGWFRRGAWVAVRRGGTERPWPRRSFRSRKNKTNPAALPRRPLPRDGRKSRQNKTFITTKIRHQSHSACRDWSSAPIVPRLGRAGAEAYQLNLGESAFCRPPGSDQLVLLMVNGKTSRASSSALQHMALCTRRYRQGRILKEKATPSPATFFADSECPTLRQAGPGHPSADDLRLRRLTIQISTLAAKSA